MTTFLGPENNILNNNNYYCQNKIIMTNTCIFNFSKDSAHLRFSQDCKEACIKCIKKKSFAIKVVPVPEKIDLFIDKGQSCTSSLSSKCIFLK